jgi:hypothetical protein
MVSRNDRVAAFAMQRGKRWLNSIGNRAEAFADRSLNWWAGCVHSGSPAIHVWRLPSVIGDRYKIALR